MNKNFIISPSIMCSTPADMEPYAHAFEASGIDAIHFDVMDGYYVPNIMLGVRDYTALKKATKLPIDLHLMCTDPEGFVQILQPAEGDWVSFHPETARNPHRLLMDLKARGCKTGIALSPGVPVSYITELGTYLDFVLVMAVNPGFAGQKMLPDHLDKLRRVREETARFDHKIDIIVDGNTTVPNSIAMLKNGATGLVIGTSSAMKYGAARFCEEYERYILDIMRGWNEQ